MLMCVCVQTQMLLTSPSGQCLSHHRDGTELKQSSNRAKEQHKRPSDHTLTQGSAAAAAADWVWAEGAG